MAKKKRKKRHPVRPAEATGQRAAEAADRPPSHRAERKEQARRERERRIKAARRRQRMRRAARWGAFLGVVGGIGAFAFFQIQANRDLQDRSEAAAQRLGCSGIETSPDLNAGLTQVQVHSPPFAQGQNGVPATNGRHSSTLPPEPPVYNQPVPEENVVHNLEHGYGVIYYRQDGENALADELRQELENLANDENKVIMAPYPDLANAFDLAAWRKLRTCDPPADADPDDAVTVARAFIEQFRGGGLAPEPQGV